MKNMNATSLSQSAVLVLLFLALIVQSVLYISFAENLAASGLSPFPDSEIRLLKGYERSADPSSLVIPSFVGVISDSKKGMGVLLPLYSEDGEAAGNEVWQYFAAVLESSSKGTAKKINFSTPTEKSAYLERLYKESSESYYARFSESVQFSVLTSFLSGQYDLLPENPDFAISDMFLVCGSNGEASIVATDLDGGVLKIFPSRNITFNKEIIETYNNTEDGGFVFESLANDSEYDGNSYFPVLLRSFSSNGLVRTSFEAFFDVSENSEDARMLVEMLGMNIDNTKTYKTAEDDVVFVEDVTRLHISKSGVVEYISDEGGTPSREITGMDIGGYGGAAEVAKHIAFALSEKLSLFDGDITLKGTYFDGEILKIVYRYTANGTPIRDNSFSDDDGDAVVLEFMGDKLLRARINIIPYRFTEKIVTDMPQKSALALLDGDIKLSNGGKITYFGAQYSLDKDESEAKLVFALTVEEEESR